ncbi:MAG TPA: acyl-ACP thioesterase domain-containing protein [Bacteroidales bacterium]|nr:acyl-ACP thioesterase domain-containing protein [Bacteroidales bacterium]
MTEYQFEKEYMVHVYEMGPDRILSMPSLFNFMQDIASDHAESLGFGRDDLMKDKRFWALSRMYAEIEQWPKWEDKIIVKTWPNGTDKLFALRNYEIRFPDGRIVAQATSSWLVLDYTTRRIQRPENALSHFKRNFEPMDSPLRYASKLEAADGESIKSDPFKIKISDLDINLHTNNVRYLQWINDTYDLDFVMKNSPKSVEINYLSESLFNEDIIVQTTKENIDKGYFNHSVFRENDNKELCRIRIGWTGKPQRQ